jgi:hypothetical protein
MKYLCQLAVILVANSFTLQNVNAAENQIGTLTLKTDKIIFQTKSESFTYPVGKIGETIPDAKIVKFELKVISERGKDTDVSELTLENTADGTKLVLVKDTPVKVIHVLSGPQRTWKLP